MKKILFALLVAMAMAGVAQNAVSGDVAPYAGEYLFQGGQWLTVTRMGVTDELAKPFFVDWQSGRMGPLAASGTDRWVSPPAAAPEQPWQTELTFSRDAAGKVVSVTVREKGGEARTARRQEPWTEHQAEFSSAGASLSGTLRLPRAKGPHPAIVLVHGSGPGERVQLAVMASFFGHLGMATLAYDKRGCGRSGGDWKKSDLEDLAADALAGVTWLRAAPGVDPKRVGLWGISQGGWITPMAGAMGPQAVAFVINSSGPGTSLRRQDLYMLENVLKAGGLEETDVRLAIETYGTLYDFGRGKATAAALDALNDKMRQRPGLADAVLPPAGEITPETLYAKQKIGDPAWFYHLDPDRDALAPYRALRCPLLVTYGSLDMTVPVEESARRIGETLAAAGHADHALRMLKTAGHGLALMDAGPPPRPAQPARLADELFAVLEDWLGGHGFTGVGNGAN
jgi:pimeloyl-ACP methyl ester carboxylesterase